MRRTPQLIHAIGVLAVLTVAGCTAEAAPLPGDPLDAPPAVDETFAPWPAPLTTTPVPGATTAPAPPQGVDPGPTTAPGTDIPRRPPPAVPTRAPLQPGDRPGTPPPGTPSTPAQPPPVFESRAEGTPGDGTSRALLSAVRLGGQVGADRIVFEFEGSVPGHYITYQDLPVTNDPGDEEVVLAGSSALQISLIGGSAYLPGATEPVHTLPLRVAGPGTGPVREMVSLSDWEGVALWAAGVDARHGFRVSVLDGPPRLIVDVVDS